MAVRRQVGRLVMTPLHRIDVGHDVSRQNIGATDSRGRFEGLVACEVSRRYDKDTAKRGEASQGILQGEGGQVGRRSSKGHRWLKRRRLEVFNREPDLRFCLANVTARSNACGRSSTQRSVSTPAHSGQLGIKRNQA